MKLKYIKLPKIEEIVSTSIREIGDTSTKLGFVIVRHVNSQETNQYWIECLRCIRTHYPNEKVLIVDDNSNPEYLNDTDVDMTNVEIVHSEFPKRGELLGYYYFHKLKPFEKAIILHDSVFIQRRLNIENIHLAFVWNFPGTKEFNSDGEGDIQLLTYLKNSESLIDTYKSEQWKGCFGVMSVISSVILDYFIEKYDLFRLIAHVDTRPKRMNLERVFGVLCSLETNNQVQTLCGDIFHHPRCFHLKFDEYKQLVEYLKNEETLRAKNIFKLTKKNPLIDYSIFKVWTGR